MNECLRKTFRYKDVNVNKKYCSTVGSLSNVTAVLIRNYHTEMRQPCEDMGNRGIDWNDATAHQGMPRTLAPVRI